MTHLVTRRITLMLLLVLTALQAVGPLLHAHRGADVFGGGLHLPGLPAVVHAQDRIDVHPTLHGAQTARADAGAVVTPAAGLEDRHSSSPDAVLLDAGRRPEVTPSCPVAPAAAGSPLDAMAAVWLRPWPQAPPAA